MKKKEEFDNLMQQKRKYFFKIALLIFGIYFTYDYYDNRNEIKNLNYGVKANELRKALHVPIIDEYMKARNRHDDGFFGNGWSSWKKTPNKNEILHIYKNVTPSEKDGFILNDENDGFRKKNGDGKIMQLNIFSTIIGDSILKRKGRFFYYESKPRMEKELNEIEIDSIAKSWNLDYLTKK
ncbi:hypothetical protein [Flavobacterium sp. GP15]|uniref:hypothetical protein n=1 Tax=Flavobacterium sp. GP15 TaxID=2758567 RepID=UPI00165D6C44|nr:hypothetical protein [Flavobacterium sp. GP15]